MLMVTPLCASTVLEGYMKFLEDILELPEYRLREHPNYKTTVDTIKELQQQQQLQQQIQQQLLEQPGLRSLFPSVLSTLLSKCLLYPARVTRQG